MGAVIMQKYNLDLFIENQDPNTYLVYNLKDSDILDETSLGMLKNNNIDGLLSIHFTQINGSNYLRYNISECTTISDIIKNTYINKNQCISIVRGILNAFISIGNYMIEENTILLDMDYIFVNELSYETNLLCLPIENLTKNKATLNEFIKNFLFNLKREPNDDSAYITKMLDYLNSANVFSVYEFLNILNNIDIHKSSITKTVESVNLRTHYFEDRKQVSNGERGKSSEVRNSNKQKEEKIIKSDNDDISVPKKNKKSEDMNIPNLGNNVKTEKSTLEADGKKMSLFYLLQHYNKENASIYKTQRQNTGDVQRIPKTDKSSKKDIPTDDGKYQIPISKREFNIPPTTVLSNDMGVGATTVLNNEVMCKAYLIRLKNNYSVCINKPVFRVGKEEKYVDYFISDNAAISRSHADIITNNGRYFIKDRNSTNHTFVDGNLVQSEVEYEIFSGNKIRLADEDFEFKVY